MAAIGLATLAIGGPLSPAHATAEPTTCQDVTTEMGDAARFGTVLPYTILIDVPVLVALGGQDELVGH
jgi:hypothetical protein